ncbi:major facilitator superfamily domain-containing protein [Pilobolus umbonatus]|nr:major facilitator superfamily domain-containing protein [Pilobolus umbonatus]
MDVYTPLLPSDQTQEALSELKGYSRPLLSIFFISIVIGLNDGSLGAIIPSLKKYYEVSNEEISLLFLFTAGGFCLSASLNGYIVHRLGELKTMLFASSLLLISYLVLMMGFPFHVMSCTMICIGVGSALLDAAMNVYAASVPMATIVLNILHAFYGIGAMICPLVVTFLLEKDISWKGVYVFLSCASVINIIIIFIGFYHIQFVDESAEENNSHGELTRLAILNRVTMIGAAFILVYVGVEVTLGGWGYTYLTEGRLGDKIVMGRVVSGYWAGLAAGRLILGYLSSRYGEKLMISLFTLMTIGGCILMTVSTDIHVVSTVYICLGFLLGPMFPTMISLASKKLPKSYHATSLGFMSALGAGGAALFPFIMGQISGRIGINSMPQVCIVITTVMLLLWACVPSDRPFFTE